jgi:DNA-binding transcriptional regulator GbsR (MarR family)
LWSISRKTYGYRKKQDAISYGQITEATGLSRRMIIYAVQNLEAKNIITITHDSTRTNIIGLQKDYELWKPEAVGAAWQSLLNKKRTNYHKALVQDTYTSTSADPLHQISADSIHQLNPATSAEKIQTSAEKTTKLVQRNEKTSVSSLHPQNKTKEITKETITKEIVNLPDFIKPEIFTAFSEMRKKIKKPLTDYAVSLIIKELEVLRANGDDPNEILEQSIRNGWQDVYELKNKGNKKTNNRDLPTQYTPPEEFFRRQLNNA